ncbi:hypothetical protein [Helicobacter bilis]|uniref:Uncharacterized protein n=1 Tax=Helicobacter bilis TaxID=37372 RepID=A0A4U8U392_9HELI|nr:hypothetical protein [Helicobacter bilis]TLE07762.1 hypothetical protein LS79_011045 [Helicobacter bilis]
MIDTNNNTNKGFNTNAYKTQSKAKGKVSNKTSNKANNKANNNNNNNILANALIDYVACIDSVSNICIKYNITRQAFYKYKSKLAGFYNMDYDIKHKQSKKALYDMLMILKHIDNFAKSNNTLLDYAGKAFYSNIQNLLNIKRHDKLSNNINKLASNDVFNEVSSTDNANNDLQDNNATIQASNDVMLVSNEINTLETELILNDSITSNDLLLSSEISQDKANNKALNTNSVIIDF